MSGIIRGALAGALLLVGALAAVPAHAEETPSAPTPPASWTHREDGSATESDSTYALTEADSLRTVDGWQGRVGVYSNTDPHNLAASFIPPAEQALEVGTTYSAGVSQYPTAQAQLLVWRDGAMCGKTQDELSDSHAALPAATAWFHISELEYDADHNVARFAATYGVSCQYVGGVAGFEGSVAVNSALAPVEVPAAPVAPEAVSGIKVTNVDPYGSGTNTTTLTWTNPAGFADVSVEMVQSSDRTQLPARIGGVDGLLYRGRASRYVEDLIDFMDTRTYRLIARGINGRLGPPAFVTVMGTRLSVPELRQTITIGQEAEFSGRLSESWDYIDFADVMKGPGLVGRAVVLCEQSSLTYVHGACTQVARTTTTTDGRFTLTVTPRNNSRYSVRVPATSSMLGNNGWVLTTSVAPQTDLRAPESTSALPTLSREVASPRTSARTTVPRGSTIHFNTSRARAGTRGILRLQRLEGTTWHSVLTKRWRVDGTRRMSVPFREYKRGLHAYRIVKLADSRHVNGYSKTVYVDVR